MPLRRIPVEPRKPSDVKEYFERIADRRAQLHTCGVYRTPPSETTTNPKFVHEDPHLCQNAEAGIYEPVEHRPHGVTARPMDFDDPPRGLIRLHPDDVHEALGGADMQRDMALRGGAKERYGSDPKRGRANQRVGALGELALARALGIPWDPQPGAYGEGPARDVAGWEVRTRRGLWALCLQPELKETRNAFMLVQAVHWPYLLNLAGWMWGVDGLQGPWLGWKYEKDTKSEHPLYHVPANWLFDRHFLHPGSFPEFDGRPREKAGTKYSTFQIRRDGCP